jgi:hypothetical protein
MNANPSIPEFKIRMLNHSLQCFIFSLIGLIPVIGLPFALAALWIGGRVREQEKKLWNAAKPIRIWGVVIAAFSLIVSSGILMIIIYHAVNNY